LVARGAALLLAAAALVAGSVLPAAAAAPDLLTAAPSSLAAGPTRVLGFWLGRVDEAALRERAIVRSGLPVDAAGLPVVRTLADARALRRALVAVHGRADRRLTDAFRAAAAGLGVRDLAPMTAAPLVVARVTPAQEAALRASPLVTGVEQSEGDLSLAMTTAYPTVGGPAAYAAGYRGDGVRVAVVEYATIDFSRPTLTAVPRQRLRIARTPSGLVCRSGEPLRPDASTSHMTRVAAIIAGRSSGAPRGIAPGATIVQVSIDMPAYDNLETAARVARAIECAITQGDADVINLSLSEPRRQGYLRTFLDHLVRTYGVFVAVASGNAVYGTCPDGEPVSPATAWNVLTVGGTDDRGTARWSDDRLWSENGRNAVCTDDLPGQAGDKDRRLKPEISAVARNIGVAGYPLSSGTSYATPMVSGAAATLIARDPSLATTPHLVKAILIASSRLHRTPVTPGGRLSTDREGAGTLVVDWANAIVTGRKGALQDAGGYAQRIVGSTIDGDCRAGEAVTLELPGHAGRRMRVAIAWMSHAKRPTLEGATKDRRKADLDLLVRDPSGDPVRAAGTSRAKRDASNVEWLDFTAATDGTYTAVIRPARWDCDLVSEPVGIAWVAFPD
jgi:hypothetical protein